MSELSARGLSGIMPKRALLRLESGLARLASLVGRCGQSALNGGAV